MNGDPLAAMTEEEAKRVRKWEKERADVACETNAMGVAFNFLQPLGDEARYRAVIWLAQALDLPLPYRADARRRTEDVPF
jgi:hypothetical protein